jgi:hypothetical protein
VHVTFQGRVNISANKRLQRQHLGFSSAVDPLPYGSGFSSSTAHLVADSALPGGKVTKLAQFLPVFNRVVTHSDPVDCITQRVFNIGQLISQVAQQFHHLDQLLTGAYSAIHTVKSHPITGRSSGSNLTGYTSEVDKTVIILIPDSVVSRIAPRAALACSTLVLAAG